MEQRWADESPAILTPNHNLVISAGAQNPNSHWKHKQWKGEAHGSRYEQERERWESDMRINFKDIKELLCCGSGLFFLFFSCWWSVLCAVVCAEMMVPTSIQFEKIMLHQLYCSKNSNLV